MEQWITTGEIDQWGTPESSGLHIDGELDILGESADCYNPYAKILDARTAGGTALRVMRVGDHYVTA